MRIAAKLADPTAMLWSVEASACMRGWRDERDRRDRVMPSFKWGREPWEAGSRKRNWEHPEQSRLR